MTLFFSFLIMCRLKVLVSDIVGLSNLTEFLIGVNPFGTNIL